MTEPAGEAEALIGRFRRMKWLVGTLVISGLFVQTLGNVLLTEYGTPTPELRVLIHLGGLLFQILACVLFLRLKGRRPWIGVIGALGFLGILVVYLMDKQCHRCGHRDKHNAAACGECRSPM